VLVVDPQETFRAAWWKEKLKRPDPVLADPMAWACASYGVAKQLMVHDEWVNVPAAFVVDRQGILRYAHVGTGFDDRATPDELLAAIAALPR
jgi:peroxiredoxin